MNEELQEFIFRSLKEEPEKWGFYGENTIRHASGIELWITNRPHFDLYIRRPYQSRRVKGSINRRRLRNIIDDISEQRILKMLNKS